MKLNKTKKNAVLFEIVSRKYTCLYNFISFRTEFFAGNRMNIKIQKLRKSAKLYQYMFLSYTKDKEVDVTM